MGIAYRGEYGCDTKGRSETSWGFGVDYDLPVCRAQRSKRTFRFKMTISALERKKLSNLNIARFMRVIKRTNVFRVTALKCTDFLRKIKDFSHLLFL